MSCNLPKVMRGLSEKQRAHVLGSLTIRCCPNCPAEPRKELAR